MINVPVLVGGFRQRHKDRPVTGKRWENDMVVGAFLAAEIILIDVRADATQANVIASLRHRRNRKGVDNRAHLVAHVVIWTYSETVVVYKPSCLSRELLMILRGVHV